MKCLTVSLIQCLEAIVYELNYAINYKCIIGDPGKRIKEVRCLVKILLYFVHNCAKVWVAIDLIY